MLSSPYVMRHSPQPAVTMPIACRSCGHYSLLPGYKNRATFKTFVELFWCVRGSGDFQLDGREVVLKAGEVLVLFCNRIHDWHARSHWEFRWMTLDGECPDAVVQAFGFDETPTSAGMCPHQLFDRLSHEIEDASPKGQLVASATGYEILALACARRSVPESSHVTQCIDLIRKHYGNSQVNVAWLAKHVGIHRTNLSKLFHEKTRVSPIDYLVLYRVSQAVKLLQNTTMPVAKIAERTGFSSASYFTNVIRRRTGLSPLELRLRRVAIEPDFEVQAPTVK
jgi:AraC-like DNA-binding protein